MATASDVLTLAAAELGTREHPPGSNRQPYAALAGHANGFAWCASFVVAMFRAAGIRLPSESAYTPTMAAGFRKAKAFHGEPAVGDVAFFDFPDARSRIQHVGIVEGFTKAKVTTIDGNTSAGAAGSEDDGGMVARRTRPRTVVVGYGRPAYTDQQEDFMAALSDDQQRALALKVDAIFDVLIGNRVKAHGDQTGAQHDLATPILDTNHKVGLIENAVSGG